MQVKRIIQLFIIISIFLSIYLSGCTEYSPDRELKTIEIQGMYEIYNINNHQNPIKLVVTGMDCLITVSRETELVEVILDGDSNVVRVSTFHTFNRTIKDVSSRIEYYD
jgi:hypothetical protein